MMMMVVVVVVVVGEMSSKQLSQKAGKKWVVRYSVRSAEQRQGS